MKKYSNVLQVLAFIFLVNFNLFNLGLCEKNNVSKKPNIVIIGAGPSGIAAATKLLENGFNNITILEAENRIGGRIHTAELGNYSIDLGGQWVHGEVGNVAFQLANPFELLDVSDKEELDLEQIFFNSDGHRLDPELSKKLINFFFVYVYGIHFDENSGYDNLGQYVVEKFEEVFKDDPSILKDKQKFLNNLELMRVTSESAESWYDISAPGLSVYKICPGDQIANWKKRGYSTILDILMKRYPDSENELPVLENTKLNTEVISINYSDQSKKPWVKISTSNGQDYKADHVIVTVSLGVLKDRYKTFFVPPLPDYKINAIEATGFGDVAKIFILFEKPFWDVYNEKRVMYYSLIWDDAQRKEIETDPEKKWLLGISGILTVEYKPNLLVLWISGKYVKHMESLPEETVFNHSVENIQRFFGKVYNVTTAIAMRRSRWYSNPHFKGTYSYRSVETHKQKVFPEMLERPIDAQNLRVLFAGEATDSDRFSTVDGAIKSGWKAANRLINYYQKSNE